MTSGVLLESSASRSWFSAGAPPTIAPAGSVDAQAVDRLAELLGGRVDLRDGLEEHDLARMRRAAAG